MNQKEFANVILIVIIVMLVGVVGYFSFVKKSEPVVQQPTQNSNSSTQTQTPPATSPEPTPKQVNWENLIPAIRTVIGSTFLGIHIEESRSLSIFQKNDITGDGVYEALVNLGSGGAYTSYLTLMRAEDGKPVVAQFKQKDGKVSPIIFLAGASVMNGADVGMLSDKNAIYAGEWGGRTDSGTLKSCSVEAYQWNSQTRIFDFSLAISNEVRPEFCQKAGQ